MVGLRGVGPEIDGELRLYPQDVAPFERPVVRKLGARHQFIDERRAFLGTAVLQKLPCFRGARKRTNDVQIDTADKHGIGADTGGFDAETLELGEDDLIDPTLGLGWQGPLEGVGAFGDGLSGGGVRVVPQDGAGNDDGPKPPERKRRRRRV